MIESQSSSGDSDTNNKFDMLNMMESPKPMMKLAVFAKLKKMVLSYKDMELDDIDRKLLRGLFVKHIKDFDEEKRNQMKGVSLFDRLHDLYDSHQFYDTDNP